MPDLDIVGSAAVDIVPTATQFHNKLSAIVLPAADRVGEDAGRRMGDAISRHLTVDIPQAITNGGRAARASATREGGQVGGAFGRAIKQRLEVAFRSLPRADVRLGDAGFNADMDRLRARIQTLAGKTVGIDIDAGAALAEVTAIDAALARLAAQNPSVQVRTDTAAARAALAEVQNQIRDVSNDDATVTVHANTGNARREILQLVALLGVVAAMPVVPVAVAGIGALTSTLVAAGAGVGVFALAAVPAIKGVTEALQAKTAADKEAKSATDNSAASSVKAAQQALTLASAQQAVTSAHRQAAQSIADANRRVTDAERSLTDAKRSARDAEDALTQARRDARQELRSLQDQMLDGILDEREATLRVTEAREELARVTADPKATELQRQRAQLSVDEALRNADKQKQRQAELKRSVDDAQKAGVDGSEKVRAAAQRVAQADRQVADQSRAVADARRKVGEAQVQAADAVASAERGLQAARLAAIDTTAKTTSEADKYRAALAKLTPAQRELFDSIAGPKGIKSAFSAWWKSLSPDVMPVFVTAVNAAKRALPGLSPLVRESAAGIKDLQSAAGDEVKSPFWRTFKKDIEKSARPAIVGLGKSFGNVLKGMAGAIGAFLPHTDSIADSMVRQTAKFAKWGTKLRGSKEFEGFLDYAAEQGPKVADLFGAIVGGAIEIGKALSSFSGSLLDGLTSVVRGIADFAEKYPWAVKGVWLLIVAVKVFNITMAATNAVMAANPIGLIVLAIVALVAIVVLAYKNVGWFRTAVDVTWAAIKTATMWLWEQALKPFFAWFGGIVVWLYEKVVKPYVLWMIGYWKMVGDIFVWLWVKIIKPYIDFMVGYWKMVADVIVWIWSAIFKPVFGFIGALIVWWWNNIVKKYFGFVMAIIHTLGDFFSWLYKVGIKPHVDKISDICQGLWKHGIKPAFEYIKKGIGVVADAFETAKDAIKEHWGSVAKIAAMPVNFLIEWVYNKGIKALFDGVSKYVGMDPLPKGPKLLDTNPKLFAGGGRTSGGVPGKDSIPALLMADEFVIKRDSARQIGFENLAYMNATGEIPRFAKGGLVSGVWDWTKDTVSDVASTAMDWARTGADLLTNPSKVWTKLMKPILAKVKDGVGSSPMGKALGKLPRPMVDGLKDMIVNAASSMFGGGGGSGQWAKPVSAGYGTKFGVAGNMWSSGHHTGLDFPAPTGTPVRAVDAGSVIGIGRGGPYGNNIEISHGGGLTSLYAHLSKILVGLNGKIGRGDHIGDVGATGNVTGPHLHLEARQNGRSIDPMPFLTGGGSGFSSRARGSAQQYAKGILSSYGWGPGEFGPLQKLWEGESNWRWNAKNPSSGAYGIPQALPANKMASAGSDWLTNFETQIRWGLGYIKSRPDYGSPSRAYSKWLSRSPHWYDEGGYLPPGLSLVANGTGAPEPVFTGSQWDDIRAAKSGGGASTVHADVRVFVGDREITDIVRTEIDTHDAEVATDLRNGRWV